jgi:hypothetical protein
MLDQEYSNATSYILFLEASGKEIVDEFSLYYMELEPFY